MLCISQNTFSMLASHQRVPPLCVILLMFNSWYKDLFARWQVVEDFVLWNLELVGLACPPFPISSSVVEGKSITKELIMLVVTIKYYCKEGQPKELETIQNKRLKKWNSFPRMAKEWYPKWQFGAIAMMSFPILNRGVACGRSLSKPATKTYIGSTRQLPSNLLHERLLGKNSGKLRLVFRKSTKEDVVPMPREFTSYQKVGKPWLFSLQTGGWNMLPRYQKNCFIRNQKGPMINPPNFIILETRFIINQDF